MDLPGSLLPLSSVDEVTQGFQDGFTHSVEDFGSQESFQCGPITYTPFIDTVLSPRPGVMDLSINTRTAQLLPGGLNSLHPTSLGSLLISFSASLLQLPACVSLLGPPWQIATNLAAYKNRNIVSHSFGAKSLKLMCHQDNVPSKDSREESFLDSPSIWCLPEFLGLWLHHSLQSLPPSSHDLLLLCGGLSIFCLL